VNRLLVHLHDRRTGTLVRGAEPGDYSFLYDRVATAASGETLLSVSLPRREQIYEAPEARPFFEGLLPEGEIRERIARDLKVSAGNSFELLARLGRDCAGAVVLLPEGESLPSDEPVAWLSEVELTELIERLPRNPLGISSKVRLSLAGLQRKAVLIRRDDGAFGTPTATAPSTHIVKPQYADADYPDLVFNEHFCMRVAAAAGLVTAHTEIARIADRPCLVVERFDRDRDGATTTRRHQEDLCQALGVAPGLKYHAEGGPGLREVAGLLRDVSRRGGADVLALIRATALNYILGNADAHAKNFALLHRDGLSLAPLYDVVCTAAYPEIDASLAMPIGENADPETIDGGDLHDMAEDCDLNYGELSREWARMAAQVLRSTEQTADAAHTEGWHRPILDRVVEIARGRAARWLAS
jgi:serine/threonine-protein kinase HipA